MSTSTSTPASVAPAVAAVATFPALKAPKMGGVIDDKTAAAIAWTGGQPKVDWSELIDSHTDMLTPNCLRSGLGSEKVKGYNLRVAAPLKLFKVGDDTYDFNAYIKVMLAHLRETGMDTIMHVVSQTDPTMMVNVVKNYEQVTLGHVETESAKNASLFDSFDKENDRTARKYLELSIDSNLHQELSLRQQDSDGAATTWMRILHLVCDGSVERFNRQKTELKALTPLSEPGESIALYSSKVRKICKSLEQANQFEWMLILWIVKALCACSVESFRTIWHPKRMALDAHLQACSFMTPALANTFMMNAGYHYTQVLQLAELSYRSLFENGDWPPANSVKDPQQAPGAFFAGMDQTSFNALVQSQVANHLKGTSVNINEKIVCYSCNGTGHTKNQCPNNRTKTNSEGTPHWRSVPPKSGEPTTKTVGTNTFNFCTKCKGGKGFWTSTHETNTHTGGAARTTTTANSPEPQANLATTGDGLGIYQF
jgi:hypothetical protein